MRVLAILFTLGFAPVFAADVPPGVKALAKRYFSIQVLLDQYLEAEQPKANEIFHQIHQSYSLDDIRSAAKINHPQRLFKKLQHLYRSGDRVFALALLGAVDPREPELRRQTVLAVANHLAFGDQVVNLKEAAPTLVRALEMYFAQKQNADALLFEFAQRWQPKDRFPELKALQEALRPELERVLELPGINSTQLKAMAAACRAVEVLHFDEPTLTRKLAKLLDVEKTSVLYELARHVSTSAAQALVVLGTADAETIFAVAKAREIFFSHEVPNLMGLHHDTRLISKNQILQASSRNSWFALHILAERFAADPFSHADAIAEIVDLAKRMDFDSKAIEFVRKGLEYGGVQQAIFNLWQRGAEIRSTQVLNLSPKAAGVVKGLPPFLALYVPEVPRDLAFHPEKITELLEAHSKNPRVLNTILLYLAHSTSAKADLPEALSKEIAQAVSPTLHTLIENPELTAGVDPYLYRNAVEIAVDLNLLNATHVGVLASVLRRTIDWNLYGQGDRHILVDDSVRRALSSLADQGVVINDVNLQKQLVDLMVDVSGHGRKCPAIVIKFLNNSEVNDPQVLRLFKRNFALLQNDGSCGAALSPALNEAVTRLPTLAQRLWKGLLRK